MTSLGTSKRLDPLVDTRVVFSKYNEKHLGILKDTITATRPELPIEELTEYIEHTVKNAMSKKGIAMYVDSTDLIFNMIWDNLTETEKETLSHDESSDSPVPEVDPEVRSGDVPR